MDGKPQVGLFLIEETILSNLSHQLNQCEEFSLYWVANTLEKIAVEKTNAPDLIILSQNNQDGQLISTINQIKERFKDAELLILTNSCDPNIIFRMLYAGVSSIICGSGTKSQLKKSILTTIKGGSYLSPGISRIIMNYFKDKIPGNLPQFSPTP